MPFFGKVFVAAYPFNQSSINIQEVKAKTKPKVVKLNLWFGQKPKPRKHDLSWLHHFRGT
jgi:hypothetical protein